MDSLEGFQLRHFPSLTLGQAFSAMNKYQHSSSLEPQSFRQSPPRNPALLWVLQEMPWSNWLFVSLAFRGSWETR